MRRKTTANVDITIEEAVKIIKVDILFEILIVVQFELKVNDSFNLNC